MASSIPADLHQDILARLPTESVGRFRCVSKRWLSLTTDPQFTKAHSSSITVPSAFYLSVIGIKKPQLFHLNGDNTAPSSSSTLSFLDIRGHPSPILHSCNGLILCGIQGTTLLSVCNPTTRDLVVVPVRHKLRQLRFNLAFDPAASPHFKVFGVGHVPHLGYSVYRFSSKSMAWKRLHGHESFARIRTIHLQRSTFWKGNLCWITDDRLRFLDVRREKTSQKRLPGQDGAMQCACFGESGGRLHYIFKNNSGASRYRNSGYDVYEMESKSTGWSLLCYVDLGGIVDVHRELKKKDEDGDLPMKVLWFLRGGGADDVGDRLLLGIPRKIVIYHLKDESFTTICSGLPPYGGSHSYSWSDIYPHANTFFPLNASTSHKDWVCWKSKHDDLLIRLMVENSLSGQKNIPGFKIKAWHDMVEKFNEATQLNYEVRHLRDRFKSYKRDFQSVARLLRCEGFHWNPERKVVTASDANWKRQHPLAEYKRKQVPFRDLEIIFASPTTSDEVDTEIHEREDLNIDKEKDLAHDSQHGLPLKRKRQPRAMIHA